MNASHRVESGEPVPRILCVDDTPHNIRLLEAILTPCGYQVVGAASGEEALAQVAADPPDLVLLDVVMPGLDGYEVCRQLRNEPAWSVLPIVMITASGEQEKARALDAGADDFIVKPFNQPELLARVRSLLRIKLYNDTIQKQALELAELNRTLEQRVQAQVEELERLGRLRRFLPPQVANAILSSGEDSMMESHRRLITVVFCDLRGFTAFAELAEPEEVMSVLREFHECIGVIVHEHEGTVGFFEGDGLMVLFNDPVPCPEPEALAVRMAVAMRTEMEALIARWRRLGHELGFGAGIARGYATLGTIGFEGRYDYGAIGTVVNMAARLCAEANPGQVLISQQVLAEIEDLVEAEALPPLSLKGFHRPVAAFAVKSLKASGR